jgi:hypothetical protein
MGDEPEAHRPPLTFWQQGTEIVLDLHRVGGRRKTEAAREAGDMGVDRKAR